MDDNSCKKIKILNNYSVAIENEGHTLLNLLRWSINSNWNTEADLCGYTIPHPSENVSHFSIQFKDENQQTPQNVLKTIAKGCENIEEITEKLLQEVDEK
ncbi:hypothetical protein NUSPORA_01535 [Nucleospora cyclopteri]